MLRFNRYLLFLTKFLNTFQYILCYGSTSAIGHESTAQINFNTSYVTVQHSNFTIPTTQTKHFNTSYVTVQLGNGISLYSCLSISIHPMLRFNRETRTTRNYTRHISIHPMLRFNNCRLFITTPIFRFQYILCYGSTYFLYLGGG